MVTPRRKTPEEILRDALNVRRQPDQPVPSFDSMAERIAEFEGRGVREGSPFARGVGRRDPGGAVVDAVRFPGRVGGAITAEVIAAERAAAWRFPCAKTCSYPTQSHKFRPDPVVIKISCRIP